MKLDFFTLYIVIVLLSLALAAIWGSVSWQHRSFAPARIWFVGTLFTAAGGALLPFQHHTAAPLLAAAIANNLPILGFWLFLVGARRLYGFGGGTVATVSMTALFTFLTLNFWGNPEGLALTYAVGQSIPMILCVIFLATYQRGSPGVTLSLAGLTTALLGHAVVAAMNLWILGSGSYPDWFGSVATFTMLALVFGGILWNFGFIVASMHHLRDEVSALAELAHVDPLTGAWNRRKFDQLLADHEARCERGESPFSVLMLDLDHFKQVNDRLGHAGGDIGLRHLVVCARKHMRQGDQIARLGGDEFCILLPRTQAHDAEALGQCIVDELAKTPLRYKHEDVPISCSIGVASWDSAPGTLESSVIALADSALYAVKRAGRNGTALASS